MGKELAFLKEQITTLWQYTSISEPHKDFQNVSEEKEANCPKSNEAGLALSDPARQAAEGLKSESTAHAIPNISTANLFFPLQNSAVSDNNEPLQQGLMSKIHHQRKSVLHPRTSPTPLLIRTQWSFM